MQNLLDIQSQNKVTPLYKEVAKSEFNPYVFNAGTVVGKHHT